ncbi:MAG: SDR family NAD(P)-dependent oxidoreductase [Pseudomonadales bacterium]|jgi:NAD(P)-dependent dehydrogenase (short-subunit alcohol dehydrogenase family)|nr:SDR family NAD(P)-dependent oxidoreductase [Pseudomonadales bacterium]MDA0760956.1 SDR family NAD(P)-dependent oxidoreductase [Pseudomonadota bacterium]MDA0956912.1 SDR family NAD(P)-dependent oxidoreductase [Pseudomonadota bacterium]MDA1207747.1 SDR family NAD(P)-dependent oxidoreductase [Pseudomonadota bacterium]
MDYFQDQVAVITGGASGIGKGLAEKCLQEGMKVILADIEGEALQVTVDAFRTNYNNPIVGHITDVSVSSSLEALRDRALTEFGAIHLLFNNAGVGGAGGAWTGTEKDWDWVIGVNLMSVVHGQRLFLPVMLEQNTPGHIVNTASVAGLIGGVTNAPYSVTKHGVVALTEHLHRDLLLAGSKLGCSVLCPGIINTNIGSSARNRPQHLINEDNPAPTDAQLAMRAQFDAVMAKGMLPGQVANIVFNGIRDQQLYIQTHEHFNDRIQTRAEDIIQGRNPDPKLYQWLD